jgi:hypothetical protein
MAEIAAIRRHKRFVRIERRVQIGEIGPKRIRPKPGGHDTGGKGAVGHRQISVRAQGWLSLPRCHGCIFLSNGKFISTHGEPQFSGRLSALCRKIRHARRRPARDRAAKAVPKDEGSGFPRPNPAL